VRVRVSSSVNKGNGYKGHKFRVGVSSSIEYGAGQEAQVEAPG